MITLGRLVLVWIGQCNFAISNFEIRYKEIVCQTLQTLNKKIMNKNQVEIQGSTANGSRELSREFVSCSFILWEGNWGIV